MLSAQSNPGTRKETTFYIVHFSCRILLASIGRKHTIAVPKYCDKRKLNEVIYRTTIMTKNHSSALDLRAIARRAAIDAGFAPDVPPAAISELQAISSKRMPVTLDQPVRDLRSLLWSSIDNAESRDLDQVEYAERQDGGRIRIMVGIADVAAYVSKGSALDAHATRNCTSLYTGVETFPMLPEQLSTDITSLLGDVDRTAVIIDLVVNDEGEIISGDVYLAALHNYAKLAYEPVGAWLDRGGPVPPPITSVPGMADQIRLQLEAARRLLAQRQQNGALHFETLEATPVISDGQVTGFSVTKHSSARDIIENFMIAANIAMAHFLEASGSLSLRRVVRTPERWPRIVEIAASLGEHLPTEPDARALADFMARRKAADPAHFPDLSLSIVKLLGPGEYAVEAPGTAHEGHFGLALRDYTHSTAPNRRYADLVTQRLVKAVIANGPAPYTEDELARIAARCTEREDAARKVERQMRKVTAAVMLSHRIGEEFDAIVTGVTPKGTFARLIAPPVDGRVVRGERGLDVGDKVRVRLVATEPERGFIDFERVR